MSGNGTRTSIFSDREQKIVDALYVEQGIPVDRLVNDTPALKRFAERVNKRCGSSHSYSFVGQSLILMRKRNKLSPLGLDSRKLPSSKVAMPDHKTCETIKVVYRENDYPSDRLRNNVRAMKAFTEEVNRRTGKDFKPDQLGSILFRLRKDPAGYGEFPKLGKVFEGPRL